MEAARARATLFLTPEEKDELEAQAAAEGVSLSLLMYRRIFNKPDETRPLGRKPKHERHQPEGMFDMAG